MKQTQLDIGTVGQKFKSAREAKGVTVSEAAAATKILTKFIVATVSYTHLTLPTNSRV